jgi:hypothetical protein
MNPECRHSNLCSGLARSFQLPDFKGKLIVRGPINHEERWFSLQLQHAHVQEFHDKTQHENPNAAKGENHDHEGAPAFDRDWMFREKPAVEHPRTVDKAQHECKHRKEGGKSQYAKIRRDQSLGMVHEVIKR